MLGSTTDLRHAGPATAKALLAKYPVTKIVAWTVSDSSDDLLRMMQAGCSGYVLKDAGPAELRRALLSALRSESPVPRRMIPEVLRRVAESTPLSTQTNVSLTSREMQILRGVAKGNTTKRLAHDLGLKAPSVETLAHSSDLENAAADDRESKGIGGSIDGPHVQAPSSGRKQAEGARDLG